MLMRISMPELEEPVVGKAVDAGDVVVNGAQAAEMWCGCCYKYLVEGAVSDGMYSILPVG
jgi:hypothetical protein